MGKTVLFIIAANTSTYRISPSVERSVLGGTANLFFRVRSLNTSKNIYICPYGILQYLVFLRRDKTYLPINSGVGLTLKETVA